MGYEDHLVALWPMDDINPQDISPRGLGYHMTGSGLVTATDIVNSYPRGKGIEFNGTDEYCYRSEVDWRISDSQGTIAAWVKRTAAAPKTVSLLMSASEADVTHHVWCYIAADNRIRFKQRDGDTEDHLQTGSIVTAVGQWWHVIWASDGAQYRCYVDGEEVALTVATGANTGDWLAETSTRVNIAIGVQYESGVANYAEGVIGEVRYYDVGFQPAAAKDCYIQSRRGTQHG